MSSTRTSSLARFGEDVESLSELTPAVFRLNGLLLQQCATGSSRRSV